METNTNTAAAALTSATAQLARAHADGRHGAAGCLRRAVCRRRTLLAEVAPGHPALLVATAALASLR